MTPGRSPMKNGGRPGSGRPPPPLEPAPAGSFFFRIPAAAARFVWRRHFILPAFRFVAGRMPGAAGAAGMRFIVERTGNKRKTRKNHIYLFLLINLSGTLDA